MNFKRKTGGDNTEGLRVHFGRAGWREQIKTVVEDCGLRNWKALGIAAVLILVSAQALAKPMLAESPGPDDFVLSDGSNSVPIYVESGQDRAVKRAAGDLAEDIARVTGAKPVVTENPAEGKGRLVIVGALNRSGILDRLAADGKLDVDVVQGQWESYALQVVKDPLPGVDKALVIAGSDRRGTIYGIYELSESIGVSPWYWWADVPVEAEEAAGDSRGSHKQGPPAVKYRGDFPE